MRRKKKRGNQLGKINYEYSKIVKIYKTKIWIKKINFENKKQKTRKLNYEYSKSMKTHKTEF